MARSAAGWRCCSAWRSDGRRTATVELIATANALPDGGWAALLIVFAALGGFAGWLTFRFAPEASGSGIPHVEDVLATGLIMRWRTLLPVKFLGGLFALGGGMSLGREGPTVQMGAAISEGLAQRFGLAPGLRRALIAAGAGAGLTAAFNAPLAGFVFVLEELGLEASALTYSTGLIATVTSNLVMQVGLGPGAIFSVGDAPQVPPTALWLFLCLGAASGILGVLFNQGILRSLDAFAFWRAGPRWYHTVAAGALVGVVAWWFPDAIGGGERVAERLLRSEFSVAEPLNYLLLLLGIKFFLTVVCYGSGAPGGLFAPLLALGATLGAIAGQYVAYVTEPVEEKKKKKKTYRPFRNDRGFLHSLGFGNPANQFLHGSLRSKIEDVGLNPTGMIISLISNRGEKTPFCWPRSPSSSARIRSRFACSVLIHFRSRA